MTRVTEGAQGSGLNSKMAASRKLAARRGLGRNSIWSKIRPAGSYVCSATYRVRAVRHYPSSLCVTARYYHPLLVTPASDSERRSEAP